MDLWVVAATAGAGCLAKYLQNFLRGREGSLIRDKTCPLSKLSSGGTPEQHFTETRNGKHLSSIFVEKSREDGPIPIDCGQHEESSMLSSSIFLVEHRKIQNFEEYSGGYSLDSDVHDIPQYHYVDLGASHGYRRSKNTMRSKCSDLPYIKPCSSLDSRLMAQIRKKHAVTEEYIRNPLDSPLTSSLRPFLVTDGMQVISRASGNFGDRLHKEVIKKANDEVVGFPALTQIKAANYSKEKLDRGKNRMGKSRNTSTSMQLDSLNGSSEQVLFSLGISIGIMSAITANKLEIENLRESLKQNENLVQDLQDELEMKDSLMVQELVYYDDSQDAHEILCVDKKMFSNQVVKNAAVKCADEESVSLKELESVSKIEAELEAELERLELSMKVSTLQGRLSDAFELEQNVDEDIMAELVHGELKVDIIQRKSSSERTSDQGLNSTSTPCSAKHGISPHELSMCLHEVIQSRLQERIIELEAELAKTLNHVQELESEKINSWREVSNSESSSTLGSPIAHNLGAAPLIMNLSGDALDAYNEAYEELKKLKVCQNETSQHLTDNPQEKLLSTNLDIYDRQNVIEDCSRTWEQLPNGRKKLPFNEGSPNSFEYKDDDDLLLIKQIVDKARQGSPAILKAQRAMVYMDKYGN